MTNNTNNTFQNYGRSFQEKLAFLILKDRPFADRMMEVLKIEFFEYKYLQWFVDKIFEYKTKYKTHPSLETFETVIKSSLDKEIELIQKLVKEYYARIITTSLDDSDFIKSESLDFSRKQRLREGMLKATSLLNSNSFDEIKTVIDNALKAGSEIDTGHDYIKDFEKRYVENVRFPISTGWDKIDEITDGGLGRGEYGFIMAPTGAGKSFCLVHLGTNALKKNLKVIYYTMELKAEVIGQRFDACVTGIPIGELKEHKEEVLNKIKEIQGQLRIKFFPKKTASMITIRNHIERLKSEGFIPDMIILDYLDLLKAHTSKKELRHELGEAYDEFEALNQELNTVGWTASQTNAIGFSSNIVMMNHASEGFNKNFGSYLTLGLARDNNDKTNNTGKLSVCKNRSGPDGMVFNIFMDPANANIKVLGEYDHNADRLSLNDPEEEKRRIRQKYKKFKEKQGN